MSERTDRLKGFKDGEETERARIVKIIKKKRKDWEQHPQDAYKAGAIDVIEDLLQEIEGGIL